MQLGLVVGTATATLKHASLRSERMLVVQPLLADGTPEGEPLLVFDRMGAGRGERVVITNDGRALQKLLGSNTPARWSVLGVPDPSFLREARP
jgi:ethanolamine utilization protein EutN